MIYNVYILTKNGLCVFHRKYGGLDYDEALITGFLSAISSFTKDISGENFDLIVLGGKQFVSISSENLIFVAYSDDSDKVKNVLLKIKEEFIKNYGEINDWSGDKGVVNGFATILDRIVENSQLEDTQNQETLAEISSDVETITNADIYTDALETAVNHSLKQAEETLNENAEKIEEIVEKPLEEKAEEEMVEELGKVEEEKAEIEKPLEEKAEEEMVEELGKVEEETVSLSPYVKENILDAEHIHISGHSSQEIDLENKEAIEKWLNDTERGFNEMTLEMQEETMLRYTQLRTFLCRDKKEKSSSCLGCLIVNTIDCPLFKPKK